LTGSGPEPILLVVRLLAATSLAAIVLWSISSIGTAAAARPDFVLDGVIVAANPADSVALVRRAQGGRAQVLRVGQELHGFVLVEVAKGFVRLRGEEGELRLLLAGASGPVGASDSPAPAGAGSEWIRRAFSRAIARERLSKEIPVILSETDLTPRVEDGEILGLSVARLPDGTLLSECGLLPGDILVSINGEPLVGVEELWDMIARLVDQEEIRVVVRRRGEVLKLAYAFTN
jgi:type II secretion system protein C